MNMRRLMPLVVILILSLPVVVVAQRKAFNVLFIISDDMKCEPQTYGGRAITPNIDALAQRGVRFDRAYCQYPLCNPSRTSLLTGRYPGQTGVLHNRAWYGRRHPDFVSLPALFRQQGYFTARAGKIFHTGLDDTDAWSEGGEARFFDVDPDERASTSSTTSVSSRAPTTAPASLPATVPARDRAAENRRRVERSDRIVILDDDGEGHGDSRNTTRAIELLRANADRPFFIALGLSQPHSPPTAPRKLFDLYPPDRIELPVDYAPRPTVPEGFPPGSIRPRNADLFIGRDSTPETAREMIRAYLAACSFADRNVGRILDELDRLGLRDNTIVVFWGDHGYQLGEKGKWSKAGSLFEEGARCPFIIAAPGARGNGKPSRRVIQAMDLYPTLVELCGLKPPPQELQGRSLVPLLDDPDAAWDYPAFTVWSEDGATFTGASVVTERYRYANYTLGGPLLLDLQSDPSQLCNLAGDAEHAAVQKRLADVLAEHVLQYGPTK